MQMTPLSPQSVLGKTRPEPWLTIKVINDMSQTLPYDAMGSSPIQLQVMHEHGSGKAVQICPSALCSGAKGVDNPRIRSNGTLTKFWTMSEPLSGRRSPCSR